MTTESSNDDEYETEDSPTFKAPAPKLPAVNPGLNIAKNASEALFNDLPENGPEMIIAAYKRRCKNKEMIKALNAEIASDRNRIKKQLNIENRVQSYVYNLWDLEPEVRQSIILQTQTMTNAMDNQMNLFAEGAKEAGAKEAPQSTNARSKAKASNGTKVGKKTSGKALAGTKVGKKVKLPGGAASVHH